MSELPNDSKPKPVPDPNDLLVSFNAFLAFVASNQNDTTSEWHWKTEYWHCSPCLFKYKYISHLENANHESDWLFKHFKIENKTLLAKQYNISLPETNAIKSDEQYYKNTPKDLIKMIYRKCLKSKIFSRFKTFDRILVNAAIMIIFKRPLSHYFVDFITFGYSPEDVENFVNAGTDRQYIPNPVVVEKSRKLVEKLTNFTTSADVQYLICN